MTHELAGTQPTKHPRLEIRYKKHKHINDKVIESVLKGQTRKTICVNRSNSVLFFNLIVILLCYKNVSIHSGGS